MKIKFYSCLFLILSSTVQAQNTLNIDDANQFGTGLKEDTKEERELLHRRIITAVRPNSLAVRRQNLELASTQVNYQKLSLPDERDGNPEYKFVEIPEGTGFEDISRFLPDQNMNGIEVLPSAVDNSVLPSFPPIVSQGSQGSCTAFATTYYQFSHETCLARSCTNKSSATAFSPAWTYNQINGGVDKGSWYYEAFDLLQRHGAVTLSDFPYDSGDPREWDLNPEHWKKAIRYRSEPFVTLTGLDNDLSNIKQLLANGHVVNIATHINSWQLEKRIKADPNDPNPPHVGEAIGYAVCGTEGGHAMTIVGYDDRVWVDIRANNRVDAGEKGAFLVVNSWGNTWGNGGKVWLSYDALKVASAVPNYSGCSNRKPAVWNASAYYLPTKASYEPKLMLAFTLNHQERNQISITLGASGSTATSASHTWIPKALTNTGGPFAFDGTQSAVDAKFVFDLTDLVDKVGPEQNYYLYLSDSAADGKVATIKRIEILGGEASERDRPMSFVAFPPGIVADGVQVFRSVNNVQLTRPKATVSFPETERTFSPLVRCGNAVGPVFTCTVNFGDGTSELVDNEFRHPYKNDTAAEYNLFVTVRDSLGRADITNTTYRTPSPPIAVISDDGSDYKTGFFRFTAENSQGNITNYIWDVGDGRTYSNVKAVRHFAACKDKNGDQFTVSLTVEDKNGGSATNEFLVQCPKSDPFAIGAIGAAAFVLSPLGQAYAFRTNKNLQFSTTTPIIAGLGVVLASAYAGVEQAWWVLATGMSWLAVQTAVLIYARTVNNVMKPAEAATSL